jgi:diketogulonate reductase-like aldo/keto reductase
LDFGNVFCVSVFLLLFLSSSSFSFVTTSHNQTVVGEASTLSNLPRSSLFLTTKTFYNSSQKTVEEILPGLIESVKKIGKNKEGEKEYVDLFLIHAPTCGPEGRQLLWDAFQEVSFIFTLCSLEKGSEADCLI